MPNPFQTFLNNAGSQYKDTSSLASKNPISSARSNFTNNFGKPNSVITPSNAGATATTGTKITPPAKNASGSPMTVQLPPAGKEFVQNQMIPTTSTPVPTPTPIPTSTNTSPPTPSATDTAFAEYIKSLQPNADVTAAKTAYSNFTNDTNLESNKIGNQNAEIPFSIVNGQQQQLRDRAAITANRLQNNIGIAQDSATAISTAAKAKADYEQGKATATSETNKPVTINGQLVQKQPDGTYKSIFTAPKETTLPASAQEYEYAKTPAGGNYKGTFSQYQEVVILDHQSPSSVAEISAPFPPELPLAHLEVV